MIKVNSFTDWLDTETFKFPAGEVGVRANFANGSYSSCLEIEATIKNSDDIMELLMMNDALVRMGVEHRSLKLRYVPYARQDRISIKGESLSIAVMASLINLCDFYEVTITDPHSDVTPALIDNVRVIEQADIFSNIHSDWSDKWIVAPDLGANKKAQKFSDKVKAAGVVTCTKVRNPKTGKLSNYRCYDDVQGKNLIVLDDICEAGGTFHLAADALEGAASKILMVTHGIFSKGLNGLTEKYDHIYTTTSYYGNLSDVPEELKVSEITWIE